MPPRVSIVINTYNRASSLINTLKSLYYLNYPDFEVIVVNGPSTDNTEEVLRKFSKDIKIGSCPITNLSVSRNIGICMAKGDIVAFIDDDAIPEPEWLDQIVAGYDSDEIAGVGGFVYNHTGYEFQSKYIICNRFGDARMEYAHNPTAYFNFPYSSEYCANLGTNTSFRRDVLLKAGGFDEEYDYYLDETDVCLRIVDMGYIVKFVDKAYIHHKFLPSNIRNNNRVIRKWYPIIKNKAYFAVKNASGTNSFEEILSSIKSFIDSMRNDVIWCIGAGLLSNEDRIRYDETASTAMKEGLLKGLTQERKFIEISKYRSNDTPYKRCATLFTEGNKLCICYLSQDFPPEHNGGIARFTHDLAYGMAKLGHQIHVITKGRGHNTVDFEDGVWVHRIVPEENDFKKDVPIDFHVYRKNLNYSVAAYKELKRINSPRKINVVEAPIWDAEGLYCIEDESFPTVISLETSLKIVAENYPQWQSSADIAKAIETEEHILKKAVAFHAISHGIVKTIEEKYNLVIPQPKIGLVPLGVKDESASFERKRVDGDMEILFVGRLEKRKGIDVLLDVIQYICNSHGNVRFVIVGDNTIINEEDGETYMEGFLKRNSGKPFINRVIFKGKVTDAGLYQHYADCDIFVAPSRYESFGIVFLEAMMFGKPVIGCDAGGMPEIIQHDENGILVKPSDSASLKNAIEELILKDPAKLKRMGEKSREIYENKFTVEKMVEKLLDFYKHIAVKRGIA